LKNSALVSKCGEKLLVLYRLFVRQCIIAYLIGFPEEPVMVSNSYNISTLSIILIVDFNFL